jgi:hypothetical protein
MRSVAALAACLVFGAATRPACGETLSPSEHWAFRVPVRPGVPVARNTGWVGNPIDAFIAAEHEKHGLVPSEEAAKHVLLRRVYVDLIGLPPTREELHAFLADTAPDAYETVVDRLLDSPQYGERWARHWMDVWRYSDWYGRRQVPDVWNSAPQIWRWRDWILKSLNADKGYDRMVMEMLAADEIAPQHDEAGVATGYLVRNWYALNPNQWMRDNVEHTGKAFLGLTLNCAHCHDHKYDPITQEDYFRFRAFFEPIDLRQDRVPGEADPGPFQKYEYSVLRKIQPLGSVRVFDERLDAKTIMYRGGDERSPIADKPPVEPGVPAFLGGEELRIEPVELPPVVFYPGLKPFIREDELATRVRALKEAEAIAASARQVLAACDDPDKKADAELAVRVAEARLANAVAQLDSIELRIAADAARYGDRAIASAAEAACQSLPNDVEQLCGLASRAERKAAFCQARENLLRAEQTLATASRTAQSDPKAKQAAQQAQEQIKQSQAAVHAAWQALQTASTKHTPLSPVYPTKSTGRRRALAQWIASRDNPLTARVAVNHIWMRHFGRPLVATVYDFGRNGQPPTHPELLDWLAVEFVEAGWSMKHIHKLIVTSNTYRQESRIADSGLLIAKQEEGVQQSAISNSANSPLTTHHSPTSLDPENRYLWRMNPRRMEAEVVRDSILLAAGQLDRTPGGPPIQNDQEDATRRRSLYFSVYPEDGGHARFLETFDAPDACDCYRRSESMIPQQALALTNSQIALNHARLLARQLWAEVVARHPGDAARQLEFVNIAFEQVLCRPATDPERRLCVEFLERQADAFRSAGSAQSPAPATDGLVAASTDPMLRAGESLVHSLFSHNDFVVVR